MKKLDEEVLGTPTSIAKIFRYDLRVETSAIKSVMLITVIPENKDLKPKQFNLTDQDLLAPGYARDVVDSMIRSLYKLDDGWVLRSPPAVW